MDAKMMFTDGWCHDCTGDFAACMATGICDGKLSRLQRFCKQPEILAPYLVSIVTTNSRYQVKAPDGNLYMTYQEAIAATLKWLEEPAE